MTNQVTASQPSTMMVVKNLLSSDKVKARFTEVMGDKAPQFMASITNAMQASGGFKDVEPSSIVQAAFVASTYDLPIDSNLGFAALVPYAKRQEDESGRWYEKKYCQFQMMYKGFIQLAIRTGEYKTMNCSEVYEDELISYNPITGECQFVNNFSNTKQRKEGNYDKVVGYYAWFKLRSGFEKSLYMSKEDIINHAKKYSASYRSDLDKGWTKSKWTTDFNAMALKTVIKMLLSKWGILSVQIQKAVADDQKVFDEYGNEDYSDNSPDVVEAADPFVQIETTAEGNTPDEKDAEAFDITG